MELENLKSNWKNLGSGKKNQSELLTMTHINNHPRIKQIRLKFIIEVILITGFLTVYYNGFDGDTKPLWANLFLISATVLYILNRFIGFIVLNNPVSETNLNASLQAFKNNLQKIAFLTVITSFLFGIAIIVYFSTSITFTSGKRIVVAGMLVTLTVLVYISYRNWINRVQSIEDTLQELSGPTT